MRKCNGCEYNCVGLCIVVEEFCEEIDTCPNDGTRETEVDESENEQPVKFKNINIKEKEA